MGTTEGNARTDTIGTVRLSRPGEPLGTEEEFAAEVAALVADYAPHAVFALVEEVGERVNAWVYAYGVAFDDHVELVGLDGRLSRRFPSAEHARRRLERPNRKLRIVWTTLADAPVLPTAV